MTADAIIKYITETEKNGKMPEVTLRGRRMFATLNRKVPGSIQVILSMPMTLENALEGRVWSEQDLGAGLTLKPIPFNELDPIDPNDKRHR
jgi:hypothetical protein